MDEYIKGETLLKKLQERDLCLCVSEADIMYTPTEDVAPVVHGRWTPYNNEIDKWFHYCSVCKTQAFNYEDGGKVVEVLGKFFHDCGARMNKEDNNEHDL